MCTNVVVTVVLIHEMQEQDVAGGKAKKRSTPEGRRTQHKKEKRACRAQQIRVWYLHYN